MNPASTNPCQTARTSATASTGGTTLRRSQDQNEGRRSTPVSRTSRPRSSRESSVDRSAVADDEDAAGSGSAMPADLLPQSLGDLARQPGHGGGLDPAPLLQVDPPLPPHPRPPGREQHPPPAQADR